MRRLHLFEFGDLPWFPRVLHDAETGYLTAAYRFFPLAQLWAEKIAGVLRPGVRCEILDLCSGSGGAMPLTVASLEKRGYDVQATLTDLYPNPASAVHPRIRWRTEPVDARCVPPELTGTRTMFSSFHHLRPDAARGILRDAFDQRQPVCIFESGPGGWIGLAAMVGVPLAVLALMPFARPFRWSYLLFTYLIPLMPLVILWDGIVSMLRIYSPEQMREMTADLRAPGYAWEIGRIKVRGIAGGLPYLIGRPMG